MVPHKLYECLAVGRPVLTGDTTAVASAFDGEVAVTPVGDPDSLATSIRELLADVERRTELARRGRERYLADYEERQLARLLDGVIEQAVSRR